MLERRAMDKRSSLFGLFISDEEHKFHGTDYMRHYHETFFLFRRWHSGKYKLERWSK